MVFSSIIFLCYFIPIFFLTYYLLPYKCKNSVLLVFSLLFYSFGDLLALPILLISIVVNHCISVVIDKYEKRKLSILIVGIIFNVITLLYYKYLGFIISIFGITSAEINSLVVPLPIGISFFTFQGISYLIDVYRGEVKRSASIFETALYISMFPQLIAGPIVRFATVAQQISVRAFSVNGVFYGAQFFIAGLAQKVLIANTMAGAADFIFSVPKIELSTPVAWAGALAYSLQILFDFSGYSNMAIGLGLMMGFTFPPNFNYPYMSLSITEFWRRWHMSLSSWLKDYVYIPLGGSRTTKLRTYINLFVVFAICGVWHGANWTFLVWGMFHGSILVCERIFILDFLAKTPTVLRRFYTVLLFVVGWVIFRSESLEESWRYLYVMFCPVDTEISLRFYVDNAVIVTSFVGLFFATPFWKRFFCASEDVVNPEKISSYKVIYKTKHREMAALLLLCIALVLSLLKVGTGSYNPFIYFRF